MKSKLIQLNQEIDAVTESLERLEDKHRKSAFLDEAAERRSAYSIAYLQERLLQLTTEKHTRFKTADPIQQAALQALRISSEAGRRVSAQPNPRARA